MIGSVAKASSIFVLSILVLLPQQRSQAVDSTDTTPPTYITKVLSKGDNPQSAVVIEIDAQDSQNGISLRSDSGPLSSLTFQLTITTPTPAPAIAPVCVSGTKYLNGSGQAFSGDSISVGSSGSNQRTFYLVFKVGSLVPLPTGCPEWRNLRQNVIAMGHMTLQIVDEAGNSVLVPIKLTDIVGASWPVQDVMANFCFQDLQTAQQVKTGFDNLKSAFQKAKSRFPNLTSVNELYAKVFTPTFTEAPELASAYLSFLTPGDFSLDGLLNLPLCQNGFLERSSGGIYRLDFEKRVVDGGNQLAAIMDPATQAAQDAADKAAADQAAAQAAAKKVEKPITIVCVKGKVTKKVAGAKPICPTGYKFKK